MLTGENLRSDYVLYIIGAIFFAATGYALFDRVSLEDAIGGMLIYSAIVFVMALFGLTAFIFGYNLRPRERNFLSIALSPTVEVLMELTHVKGIGEKRAEQLKSLGIVTLADLSMASAEELARKLQISSKITNRWIMDARNMLLEKQP